MKKLLWLVLFAFTFSVVAPAVQASPRSPVTIKARAHKKHKAKKHAHKKSGHHKVAGGQVSPAATIA